MPQDGGSGRWKVNCAIRVTSVRITGVTGTVAGGNNVADADGEISFYVYEIRGGLGKNSPY